MLELRTDLPITTGRSDDVVSVSDIREIHGFPGPSANDAPTGKGVTVAVMDTGIDDTHEVFDGVTVEHHNFTDAADEPRDLVGHGTAVAGLIATLSPGVEKIVDLRVFGESGRATSKPLIEAYEWARSNADQLSTVNVSLGAKEKKPAIDRAHSRLVSAGVQDVVAAGNSGGVGGSPATASDAYGIGAMTEGKELTRFSSYNPGDVQNPDVVALGKNVRVPRAKGTSMGVVLDDDYVKVSGTSFAAPIATAAMNRYLEAHGEATERAFERTATDIQGTPQDVHGYLRYDRATGSEKEEKEKPTTDVDVFDVPLSEDDLVPLPNGWLDDPKRAVLEKGEKKETVVRFER